MAGVNDSPTSSPRSSDNSSLLPGLTTTAADISTGLPSLAASDNDNDDDNDNDNILINNNEIIYGAAVAAAAAASAPTVTTTSVIKATSKTAEKCIDGAVSSYTYCTGSLQLRSLPIALFVISYLSSR